MEKITLFVLAGGMGSRYGGLKQMESFGPSGETIIDYSIYDAIKSGFDRVVFAIRKDMEDAFNEVYMSKYNGKIDISYIFQSLSDVPNWYKVGKREKPWGTAHAVLVAKDYVKEPFLIINGDDFYGRESFELSANFLKNECNRDTYCITSYKLKNVLSDNGSVKRGICNVNNGYLENIEEVFEIKRNNDGGITGVSSQSGNEMTLHDNDCVSMNMFGVYPSLFAHLDDKFDLFLKNLNDEEKDEFLLPTVFNEMVKDNDVKFKVLESNSNWFGVTYKEDAPIVRNKLCELVKNGEYPKDLLTSY